LGAALCGIGIPKDSAIAYEEDVKTDRFLVMAHGSAEEVERGGTVLKEFDPYPSGVARRRPDLARSPSQYCRIVFVDFDQIDQVFDAEVGERHLALVVGAIHPDHAVLGLHFNSYIEQPVFVFAKFPGDAGYRFDVMDFVDVHGQAA
jgi:hypothetical protein